MAVGRPRRAVVLAALSCAVLALTPAAADAACPKGAQCGTVTVPLDHSGATPGTLSLAYAKVPATRARVGTIVFLSGGPGQAAIPLTKDIADLLGPLSTDYDLVTVDQRGTGESGAVVTLPDGATSGPRTAPSWSRSTAAVSAASGSRTVTAHGPG